MLALVPRPLYDFYADAPERVWGLSRLTDQQLGGMTMAAEQSGLLRRLRLLVPALPLRAGAARGGGHLSEAHPYRELLGLPHAKGLVGWSVLGRLPVGMTSLALLFLVPRGESYGAAGLVVAVYAVALGIGAPIGGRQVDRYGPTVVLRVRVVLFVAFLAAVVVLAVAARASPRSPWPRRSQASPCRRSRPRSGSSGLGSRDELRSTAYALEAALQEVHFVGGPLVAAALAAFEPVAAVALGRREPDRDDDGRAAPARSRDAALARRRRRPPGCARLGRGAHGRHLCDRRRVRVRSGRAGDAGPGGGARRAGARRRRARLLRGGEPRRGPARGAPAGRSDLRRFIGGAFVLSGAMLTLQLAVSIPTLCVLAFVAGLPIAPTIGALYTLIDRSARSGTVAEAFAWFGTAISVGIAAGSAVGGVLVDERGVRWSFGLGAAVALVGAVLGWARRGTLRGPAATGIQVMP